MKEGIHQGIRWNHGAAEPTVVEHRWQVVMLIRTSQIITTNLFLQMGASRGKRQHPPRLRTIIPTIGRLEDGRLLFIWSNTPLPETGNTDGVWEDVFTNRNAIHAAISSDDGKTWHGFRELYLDPRRDARILAHQVSIKCSQSQFVEPSRSYSRLAGTTPSTPSTGV